MINGFLLSIMDLVGGDLNLSFFFYSYYSIMTGFHLSASVVSPSQQTAQGKSNTFNVAVTFDRRRITSCNCTCASRAFWCAHVVAVCLYRIHQVFFQRKENVRSMKLIFRFLSLIW
jgi:hypothetical protein